MTKPELHVLLAGPRGFCAGVDRAIKIVEEETSAAHTVGLTAELLSSPVYANLRNAYAKLSFGRGVSFRRASAVDLVDLIHVSTHSLAEWF